MAGQIIILNGAPRSGKSSIVAAVQKSLDAPWMNLGVDSYARITPPRHRPGIGLRPGGERPDLEILIPSFYAALYESIAAHSRLGLNVVADVGHHDSYTRPLGCLAGCGYSAKCVRAIEANSGRLNWFQFERRVSLPARRVSCRRFRRGSRASPYRHYAASGQRLQSAG